MLRENPRRKRIFKDDSTNAEHRGGVTRSSDEGAVMALERRGYIVQCVLIYQPEDGRNT